MTESVATVIPTYGRAPFLKETLAALERQTLPPHEVVVVDDGSPTPVSLPSHPLPVKVLRIDHAGIGRARNAGVRATSAPLVHICDHDDLLEPDFYERIVSAFASRPSADVIHSTCGFIDGDGRVTPGLLPGSPPDYSTPSKTLLSLLRINPIASVATVFRREFAVDLGGFRDLDFVQDWDFWLRAASSGATFAFLGEVLAWHRVHPNQQSAPERTPLVLAESRRMLRSQELPRREWAARERKVADLHLAEAAHHAAETGRLVAACAHVALAVPARPMTCLRAVVRFRP